MSTQTALLPSDFLALSQASRKSVVDMLVKYAILQLPHTTTQKVMPEYILNYKRVLELSARGQLSRHDVEMMKQKRCCPLNWDCLPAPKKAAMVLFLIITSAKHVYHTDDVEKLVQHLKGREDQEMVNLYATLTPMDDKKRLLKTIVTNINQLPALKRIDEAAGWRSDCCATKALLRKQLKRVRSCLESDVKAWRKKRSAKGEEELKRRIVQIRKYLLSHRLCSEHK